MIELNNNNNNQNGNPNTNNNQVGNTINNTNNNDSKPKESINDSDQPLLLEKDSHLLTSISSLDNNSNNNNSNNDGINKNDINSNSSIKKNSINNDNFINNYSSSNSSLMCRICHCEETSEEFLITPCYCTGTLKVYYYFSYLSKYWKFIFFQNK